MGKVKVRHALISYQDDTTGAEVAFRNQVVELSSKEEKRLRDAGAVIDPDQEPERPGTLLALNENASDEEIITWVLSATDAEVKAQATASPILAHRLEAAKGHIKVNTTDIQRRLGEAASLTADIRKDNPLTGNQGEQDGADAPSDPDASAGGPRGTSNDVDPEAANGTNPDATPEGSVPASNDPTAPQAPSNAKGETPEGVKSPDEIVKGNADSVAKYLAEYPASYEAILEAENRLAETGANNGKPRTTVVRAAEVAAKFAAGSQ